MRNLCIFCPNCHFQCSIFPPQTLFHLLVSHVYYAAGCFWVGLTVIRFQVVCNTPSRGMDYSLYLYNNMLTCQIASAVYKNFEGGCQHVLAPMRLCSSVEGCYCNAPYTLCYLYTFGWVLHAPLPVLALLPDLARVVSHQG